MNPTSALRDRPLLADALLAGLLATFTLIESTQPGRVDDHPGVFLPAVVLTTLPLTIRRRAPLAVLLGILAVDVVAALAVTATASAGSFVAILIGVYTVFTRCSRRTRLAVLPVLAVGAAIQMARDPATQSVVEALPTFAVLAAVIMLAQVVRRSRDQAVRLRRLTAELETSRAEAEELAVAAERLRIAREMHDILAHGVSVMVLQTGAARMALHDAAPQVREILSGVEGLGRNALAELHDILGLLREPVASPTGSGTATADLSRLLGVLREAGIQPDLEGGEILGRLPAPTGRVAFRVVQESLTNALKHAYGSRTAVRFTDDAGQVTVEVRNSPGRTDDGPPATPSGGHGLTGLQERVAGQGGTLTFGPEPAGGWRVRAQLPLAAAAPPPRVTSPSAAVAAAPAAP
jgi:signal transduction histidine kinase